ncbi:bifunctional hydroxymethylpyrimidine kinase/phosphomethylpyrimidine kinase, partial [Pseudomonas aeruginosa]|uniref:bifunctional hydroxymethylpyrimidine kinase/phosphomethylpyrimidine kinase n=1 Tax=Pseudomonas aeruginosa TaxID=287 RepID=UPI002156421B
MKTPTSRPVVLCLSGHDPSGGAGLQADIEALLAQGCHAAPAVTALTVQDTVNVSDFRVLDREWVLAQANAVLADLPVAAVKLGMLGSLEMVDTVAEILAAHPHLPVAVSYTHLRAHETLANLVCRLMLEKKKKQKKQKKKKKTHTQKTSHRV